jgi:hypothetical protein
MCCSLKQIKDDRKYCTSTLVFALALALIDLRVM